MEAEHRRGRWQPFRWRLGSLMIAILGVSVVFALVRPFTTSAPVRAARAILEAYGPINDTAFKSEDFSVDSVTKSPSGYLQVRFVRVAGQGLSEQVVSVSAKSVAQARLNPWWTPPNLALQRTRPAATASPSIPGRSGGPVR